MLPAPGGHNIGVAEGGRGVEVEICTRARVGWRGGFLLVKKKDFSLSHWLKSHGGWSSVAWVL